MEGPTGVRAPAEYLDTRPVLRVPHRDVVHKDIRDDVRLARVLHSASQRRTNGHSGNDAHLPEAANRDPVRAVAPHVLHDDVGRVRFERLSQ